MLPLSVAECSVSSISTAKSTDLEGVEGVEGVKDEKFDFPASLEPKASSPVQTRVPKQNLSKLWWQDWIHLDSFKLCCFYTVLIVFTLSVFCGLTGLTVPSYLLAPRHRSRRSGYCKSCALPRWHAGRWPHVTTRWPLCDHSQAKRIQQMPKCLNHFSVNCAKALISGPALAASSQFQSAHNARRQFLRNLDEYWLWGVSKYEFDVLDFQPDHHHILQRVAFIFYICNFAAFASRRTTGRRKPFSKLKLASSCSFPHTSVLVLWQH